MRTMLLSFKPQVYDKLISGVKIFEHRKVFPNEPIKAYLYVSYPVCAIAGIMYLGKSYSLEKWKEDFLDDANAVARIEKYMEKQNYAMEIKEFDETTAIPLQQLRKDVNTFVVPQMYYYLDNTELLVYLEKNIQLTGRKIRHTFENITSDICMN